MQSLGLSEYQAQIFARYLIEEKDESRPEETKVIFDPVKKVDSQLIIVRLMTQSSYPLIYDDKREQETKIKFTKVFMNKYQELIKEID